MPKKIFVTGAEGFVGSHLIELLVKKNYKVKALVQYNSFNNLGWLNKIDPKIITEVDIKLGDVRDKEFLEKNTNDCDKIIHLAALIGIPYSYFAPRSYIDVNITGTLNLLEIAKKKEFRKFIHTSTSEIYGSAKYVPMDENHPVNPQSPYAASKSSSDQLAMSYFYSYNLPITILRPFNIFGPRQSNRAVIPTIINQAINSKKEIMLGSKDTTRDFTFVKDTVNAFEKALNNKLSNGEILNIGNNFEISIKEIVELVEKKLNKKINIKLDKKRLRPKKSEVNRLYACNKKAKKILKWEPLFSKKNGFEEALNITCDWFKNESKNSEINSKHYLI